MIAQNNILINVEKEYEGLERTVQIENENSKNYSELEMKVQNNICEKETSTKSSTKSNDAKNKWTLVIENVKY